MASPSPRRELPDALQPFVHEERLDGVVLLARVGSYDTELIVGFLGATITPLAALAFGFLGWRVGATPGAIAGASVAFAAGLAAIAVAILRSPVREVRVLLGRHGLELSTGGEPQRVRWSTVVGVVRSTDGLRLALDGGTTMVIPRLPGDAGEATDALHGVVLERVAAARVGVHDVPAAIEQVRRRTVIEAADRFRRGRTSGDGSSGR